MGIPFIRTKINFATLSLIKFQFVWENEKRHGSTSYALPKESDAAHISNKVVVVVVVVPGLKDSQDHPS